MKKILIQLAVICFCSADHMSKTFSSDPEELYRSQLFSHYLNSEGMFLQHLGGFSDDSDEVKKRDIKLSDGGLFYHDGPYVSHSQVQRKAPHFESFVTPLPKESDLDGYDPLQDPLYTKMIQPKTSANPYTYAVTAASVTPAPYHGPSTPVPYHNVHQLPFYAQSTPSQYFGPSTAAYGPSAQSSSKNGPYSPLPYHGPLNPASYYGRQPPIPYHGTWR